MKPGYINLRVMRVDQVTQTHTKCYERLSHRQCVSKHCIWCLSPILFNLYSESLTKEALEGLGDYKIDGQIIHTVKYADDLPLLTKEENVLQDMIDKLIEIGRCFGMEMNVEKQK